jgi:hypothetical protein
VRFFAKVVTMKTESKTASPEVLRLEMLNMGESEASTPSGEIDDGAPEFLAKMSLLEREQFEKQLLRRIDRRLLPMTILMYVMNYLDRNNIASARIAGADGKGLQDELVLTSTQYQV